MTAEMAHFDRRAGVLTVSDRVSAGERSDASGPALIRRLEAAGWDVSVREIVPDEAEAIREVLMRMSDVDNVPLILTTGGTGIAPRDVTPEATRAVADRDVPGISETLRAASLAKTPHAMLSRAVAVTRGGTLIVNLPGNPRAVEETFDILAPVIDHAARLLGGESIEDGEHRGGDRR